VRRALQRRDTAVVECKTVIAMVVKGLIERDAGRRLHFTDRGRASLRAMLPAP
jgi:hypothetical protein